MLYQGTRQGTRQGYLNENGNFRKGNQSCMVTELHMGAILTKMTILRKELFKGGKLFILSFGIEALTFFKMYLYIFIAVSINV